MRTRAVNGFRYELIKDPRAMAKNETEKEKS